MRYLLIGLVLVSASVANAQPDSQLPKVVLVGDSIRLSYTATVTNTLEGKAVIVSSKANGGDSGNVLKNLDAWVIREQPQFVHFNCGIHDTKKFKTTGRFQVSPKQYESNLCSIVKRIRAKTDAVVLFATTTPILDDRAAKVRSDRDYELLGGSVEQYNEIARRVMRELRVPVNDLHALANDTDQSVGSLIGGDGVHLTKSGQQIVGQCVAEFISQHLENKTAVGPWKIDEWKKTPGVTWLDRDSPIRTLTYRSEPYQDLKSTDVFAYYATPGSISGDPKLDKNLPAVVLIHGGGGTAFAEWVWLWAKRGYAAVAMDLSGRRPAAPKFHAETGDLIPNRRAKRTRLERGGPEADHVAKFQNVGGDVTDDWQYHAVAAVLRAHSLVRSFPEVDEERTAVTGISWGGYMTCLVASLDDRFKAAVPVYGCGFLYEGESVQKRMIDELGKEKRRAWIRTYDPSVWLSQCRVPILFVNGTNDKHYPLNSYLRSYDLVAGPKQIRIEAGMRHSHVHGWAPMEIGLFIDQHVRNSIPLPSFSNLQTTGEKASANITSKLPIKQAELFYTTGIGPLVKRRWQSIAASVNGESVTASIPQNATIWMLTATDSRNAMVSTRVQFAD